MVKRLANTNCRGCGENSLQLFLDLGTMPLANSYLENLKAKEEIFPIRVGFCSKCYLVQLLDIVSPEKIFSVYSYRSSYSTTFLEHARKLAQYLIKDFAPSAVLEIGSNDGYLLKHFKAAKIKCIGVDPASNITNDLHKYGLTTINAFFGSGLAKTLNSQDEELGYKFDLIVGNNVLAHVPDINDFLLGVKQALSTYGVATFEFPYLLMMINNLEFDQIYAEHVYYYSILALNKLLDKYNLEIFDVIFSEIHGGSIRIFVQHRNHGPHPIENYISQYILLEKLHGLDSITAYKTFSTKVEALKVKINAFINGLKKQRKTIAAYGAPAKGNTLLNYCKITSKDIKFTVDISPHKRGYYLPGSHLPVFSPQYLEQEMPDYTIILPWNFADEIMRQQSNYISKGGKFVTLIPEPRIL